MNPTATATERVIKTKFKLNSTASVKFKIKIANHETNGPGIIGTKLPVIPIKHRTNPRINKIISIINYLIIKLRI